jgi:SAM-dependent methyltransferase
MPDPGKDTSLEYYENSAGPVAHQYEKVDFHRVQETLLRSFPDRAELLEIGCGSGRDASFLKEHGFDVTATDGSAAMLAMAVELHPELNGATRRIVLPGRLPFPDERFDGVYSIATLMHLDRHGIEATIAEMARVLRPEGRCYFSVAETRPGLDDSGFDGRGRRFTVLSTDEWMRLFRRDGFRSLAEQHTDDILKRSGVTWFSALVQKKE